MLATQGSHSKPGNPGRRQMPDFLPHFYEGVSSLGGQRVLRHLMLTAPTVRLKLGNRAGFDLKIAGRPPAGAPTRADRRVAITSVRQDGGAGFPGGIKLEYITFVDY